MALSFFFLFFGFLFLGEREEIFAVAYQYVEPLGIKEVAMDSQVETQGTVVALPGALGLQFFYINGCQIYSYYKNFPELKEGDKIRIKGIVSQAQGEKRIKIKEKDDIQILGTEEIVSPLFMNIAEIDFSLVGSLVQVQGQVIEKKSPRLFLKGGEKEIVVYFKDSAGINKGAYAEGDFLKVTGILSLRNEELRILPRRDEDLIFVFSSPELIDEEEISFLILDDREDERVIDFQLIKPYFFVSVSILIIILTILIFLKKGIKAE